MDWKLIAGILLVSIGAASVPYIEGIQLKKQLKDSRAEVSELVSQKDSLVKDNQELMARNEFLVQQNSRNAELSKSLQEKIDKLASAQQANNIKLQGALNANRNWSDTPIPSPVAGLLKYPGSEASAPAGDQ